MFKEDTLYHWLKMWWLYKPEDELYYLLQDNPYWPFKMIGEGYYYVIVQSDRAAYGIYGLVVSIVAYLTCTFVQGFYAIPQTFFLMCFIFCIWALRGRLAWRELIISRRGRGSFMLRVLSNQEKVTQHELRNIYIRLAKKDDASGDPYFWLNLSGYELDDYRITRMTKAESALRIMGMQLAYRLGVNFFDWKDESEDHFIFHYRTFSRLVFHPVAPKDGKGDKSESDIGISSGSGGEDKKKDEPAPKGAFLSVPKRKRKDQEFLLPTKKIKSDDLSEMKRNRAAAAAGPSSDKAPPRTKATTP